jgi:hypothetical protein
MSTRTSLVIAASIVVGCICLGLLTSQPSSGQQPAPQAQPVGRFQIATISNAKGGLSTLVCCDTTTGQCWVTLDGVPAVWRDMGQLPSTKK